MRRARSAARRLLGYAATLLSLTSFVLAVTLAAPHQVTHHDAAPSECGLCVVAAKRPTIAPPAIGIAAPVLTAHSHTTQLAPRVRAGVPAPVTGRAPPAPTFNVA